MKNKTLTYFLGLVVLVIWGMIIYKIVDAASSSDDETGVINSTPVKEIFNDYSLPKDTTHLLLNYRDPFGLIKRKDTMLNIAKKESRIKVPVIEKPIDWGFIKYSGYIFNSGSKKLIAMMTINGQNIALSEGQTKDQVKLVKNMRDSVKVGYQGKTRFIKIR